MSTKPFIDVRIPYAELPPDAQKLLRASFAYYKSLKCPIRKMVAVLEAKEYFDKGGIVPKEWVPFLEATDEPAKL